MATKKPKQSVRQRKKKSGTGRLTASPPQDIGRVKEQSKNLQQKFCPVCWNLGYDNASRSWELPRQIVKCDKCKHHSIREFMCSDHHDAIYNTPLSRHDHIPIQLAKKVMVDKNILSPKILILLPSDGIFEIVNRIFLSSNTSIKDRRKGIQNKRVQPDFYCVTSPKDYDRYAIKHVAIEKTSFSNLKKGWKGISGRQNIIAESIKNCADTHGRFDLIVTTDTLSQVLDPSTVVRSILESCEYFMCIENRYTSSIIKKYTNQLVSLEETNYFSNNCRLKYPIEPGRHLDMFVRDQYQYFSSSSLLGIFKNEACFVEKDNLPKGKSRSFKTESLKEMHPHRQVVHNFSASYVLDL